MKIYWKGAIYESANLQEGFLSTMASVATDMTLKGMGFGEIPGQAVDTVNTKTPVKDKKKLTKSIIESTFEDVLDYDEVDNEEVDEDSPYWGRRAAGCLFYAKSTGNVMFALRSRRVMEPGTWSGFGGKLDGDETPIEGLERELSEEAGYSSMDEYIGVSVYEDDEYDFKYYNYLVICGEEFAPTLNSETDAFKWTKITSPPSPLHPGLMEAMPYYVSAIKKLENNRGSNETI